MMSGRVLFVTSMLFVCIASGALIQPAYYKAKAGVAQLLLMKAWLRSIEQPVLSHKPWPWADMAPLFTLKILSQQPGREVIKQEAMVVLAGASGESLAFAPALVTTRIFPGDLGNSLLAGHRDTHFRDLGSLVVGDRLVIEYRDGTQIQFKVDQVRIVDSRIEVPLLDLDHARLTLSTCYPFDTDGDNTPWRYLVSGAMVSSGMTALTPTKADIKSQVVKI